MSIVGPKPKSVYVTIKVDITDFAGSLNRARGVIRRRQWSLVKIGLDRYRERLLPVEAWENEGGAL